MHPSVWIRESGTATECSGKAPVHKHGLDLSFGERGKQGRSLIVAICRFAYRSKARPGEVIMRNSSEDYLIILKKAFGPTTLMYRNPNRARGAGHGVIRQRTEDAGKTGCQLEVGGALRLRLEAKPRAGMMEWWNGGAWGQTTDVRGQRTEDRGQRTARIKLMALD